MHHDACGVGFVARVGGTAGHDVVRLGLTALRRLAHRGAPAALGAVDGCGLLTAIPWALINDEIGGRLPSGRKPALAMIFAGRRDAGAAILLIERELQRAGAKFAWRRVPTDAGAVLDAQRASTPRILQLVIGFANGTGPIDLRLYRLRLAIERAARQSGLALSIASMSTATAVYKALVPPEALDRFYPDLADRRFTSAFAVFHQRFSTNTSADWALAQPFRILAHNGEINTILGNRSWLRARLRDATSFPEPIDSDIVSPDGSDSRSLDEVVDLLRHRGYSLTHAITRLMPPAWQRNPDLAPDIRAFHAFQALLSEPWDGPSALAFADGRYVGAALDRNGFRPARVTRTASGLMAVASETGVLDVPDDDVIDRDRLGPGDMLIVDLRRGAVLRSHEIHRRLAFPRRYRTLVGNVATTLAAAGDACGSGAAFEPLMAGSEEELERIHIAFGCSREEVELLIKPMIEDAHEAVGSMGDDAPPAALSRRPRLFTDYFRQRFAQITNPPIDPYRESAVMSMTSLLGAHGDYLDELAPRPPRIELRSPLLTESELGQMRTARRFAPAVVPTLWAASDHELTLERTVDRIAADSCRAVEAGSAIVILSDRGADRDRVAVPALLATAAAHTALIHRGLRMRASLVVDTGDARDPHQIAALCAFGASAVCPWLGYRTVRAIAPPDATGCDRPIARYRLALERGLRTIMSKMGVCTFASYCGSQLLEILGLHPEVVRRFFEGTPSFPGDVTLESIGSTVRERHRRAFLSPAVIAEYPGLHGYRRDGEYHATNPLVVRGLQRARSAENPPAPLVASAVHGYATFTAHVYSRPPAAVRDLLELGPTAPIALERVESIAAICARFFASAMSVGALSPEAHRTVARAMNMLGARSNSGEGGEEPDRLVRPPGRHLATWDGSRTKQIASARFGVTPAYLRSADEIQIKIAQGSKPGEGGQLPAVKVVPHIARLRHARPGTTLISPPVHHDIYSIEDLAQLIFDLKMLHPSARLNVKLVSSSGVGVIAVGAAKAGADAIQLSGHDGGTGASPRGSIKHAGLPWEFGLSEAHRALLAAGLRSRVVLQTDGGLKTGRDIAIAAALGADEFGFGTAALVALGCVMARQCHANTCPVGIATQREDLRGAFRGTADMLVGYLRLVAAEVRELLASLGLESVDALVGRVDLLRPRGACAGLDIGQLLAAPPGGFPVPAGQVEPVRSRSMSVPKPVQFEGAIEIRGRIANADRAVGADIAGEIAAQFGDRGLPPGSRVAITRSGSAGQSFGAFAMPGMRLMLVGDANDGLAKGMRGGEIVVAAPARERTRTGQVRVGNAALYGATGGRVFIGGRAGERFAVRNSGATAVVEGVGDHACEYMTGGVVVILGPVGANFASGMTGGVAYVLDPAATLVRRVCAQAVEVGPLDREDRQLIRALLDAHEEATASPVSKVIRRRDPELTTFVRVVARDAVAGSGGVESTDTAAASPEPQILSA
jgi:glutamate synthase (ferredoxin)